MRTPEQEPEELEEEEQEQGKKVGRRPRQPTGDRDKPLADDLLVGAAAIASYLYGDDEDPKKKRRKIYGLAESQALPFFYMGREICARKSTLQNWVAAREAGHEPA